MVGLVVGVVGLGVDGVVEAATTITKTVKLIVIVPT